MSGGRYFFHRLTRELKVIYAYESAEPYAKDPLWQEYQTPAQQALQRLLQAQRFEQGLQRAQRFQEAQRPAPPPAAPKSFPPLPREPNAKRSKLIPPARAVLARAREEAVMVAVDTEVFDGLAAQDPAVIKSVWWSAEIRNQENMVRIIEQRQTRWLREHLPSEDDWDE